MTETDYQKEAQRLATDARFIPMRTKPAGLSAKAQFGASFVLDEKNRSWIIDGDAAKGYTFYGDFNGNGDLARRRSEDVRGRAGKTDAAHLTRGPVRRGRDPPDPDEAAARPDGEAATDRGRHLRSCGTRRCGALERSRSTRRSRRLSFRLAGPNGLFNLTYGTTSFDFDEDGTFDTEIERYVNSEKYVNVGDATYEFAADKYGNRVTFTKLAMRRPDRAILKTGYAAPDFTYTDLNGRALQALRLARQGRAAGLLGHMVRAVRRRRCPSS